MNHKRSHIGIDRLLAIIRPVPNPVGARGDWGEAASQIPWISDFPEDYKQLVERYGASCCDGFFWILSPFAENPNLNLLQKSRSQLDILNALIRESVEQIPYAVDGTRGSLLPWATTDNGDDVYWVTSGSPNDWNVVVNQVRSPNWFEYSMNATGFIFSVLERRILCPAFPEDFPDAVHSCSAA